MKKIKIFQFWRVLLILGLLIAAAPLQAQTDYRVTGVTLEPSVIVSQPVKLTGDLTVRWTAPTGVTPDPMNYYLKFSDKNTPLTDTELNDTTYDFVVQHPGDGKIIDNIFFAAFTGADRYLHIKTQYLNTQTGQVVYSAATVSAAIRIDNVAPTGMLTLNPTSGSSTVVNVEAMSFTEPIRLYWLSSANTFPGGTGATYDSVLMKGGAVNLQPDAVPGNVWIYGWFEDFAGNRTTAPSASAVYNYQAPVSINHNNIFQISVGGNLGFTVDGTTTYNWTLTDMASGVAEFSESATGVHSVSVVGKKAGTFTVTATPTSGTGTLKTGTITVVQSYTRGDVNNDGVVDSGDAILVLRYSVALTTLTDTQKAAGNVTNKVSNNDIDSGDAIRILRYSVGLIDVL